MISLITSSTTDPRKTELSQLCFIKNVQRIY